jgi:ABC-type transport system involved in multi-copper enzyme maturation permease subunit
VSRERDLRAVARLEWAEVLRSRWLLICIGVYAGLAALFVLVGLRESSVLGFTGVGRVLFSLSHALLLLLPLIALAATGQVVNRARDDGGLELLLSHPLRRSRYLAAVSAIRFLALSVPLVAMLLLIGAVGRAITGQPVPWSFLLRACALCTVLLFAFVALGIAISVTVRSPARAMTYVVVAWAASVALLDFGLIGLMLSWRLDPAAVFSLAVLNPVECVRVALLAAAEPDLATLGPVGFFLTHRLGPDALLALGIGWPLCFGALTWLAALRSFRRGDLV